MADEIHVFSSTHTYAPVLTGETGKLVDLLTAVLVDGYTAQSVASITRSGTTATVTVSGGHGLVSGQWATIAGADQGDYNGRFQVTVSSSTVFTYTVANSPTTPATGTITARRASAGWNLEYSGTNKAAYRSPNNAGARHCLRVLDDGSGPGGAKAASLIGYVSMSDVDTGGEPFPTAAQMTVGVFAHKSATADSTARSWLLFANDKTFYMFIVNGANNASQFWGFGHFDSFVSGDGYNTFLAAGNGSTLINSNSTLSGVANGCGLSSSSIATTARIYIPRSGAQTGTSIICAATALVEGNQSYNGFGAGNTSNAISSGSVLGPSTNYDGGLYCIQPIIYEKSGSNNNRLRGMLPGVYSSLHVFADVSGLGGTTSTGLIQLPGVTVYHLNTNAADASGNAGGQVLIDITGPW